MENESRASIKEPLLEHNYVDSDSSTHDNQNQQSETVSSSVSADSNDIIEVSGNEDVNGNNNNNNNESIIINNARSYFYKRLDGEYYLFKRLGIYFLFMLFYLIYFPLTVFRNIAFYRFHAGNRLKDLGYEIIGESGDKSIVAFLNLFPMNLVMISALSMLIATLFKFPDGSSSSSNGNDVDDSARVQINNYSASEQDAGRDSLFSPVIKKRKEKPYIANILRRGMMMLCIGHTLRFMTYSVTSLPGAARHCFPDEVDNRHPPQPKTIHDIFTRFALSPGQNCGDLMFSGHMLQIMTPVLLFRMYAIDAFDTILQPKQVKLIEYFMWFLVVVQAFFIVSLRNHYTSDVVVGAYVTPLLWHFANGLIFPHDVVV